MATEARLTGGDSSPSAPWSSLPPLAALSFSLCSTWGHVLVPKHQRKAADSADNRKYVWEQPQEAIHPFQRSLTAETDG